MESEIELPMKLNREMVEDVAETGIIETIEAFVRFRPVFHGDTGIPYSRSRWHRQCESCRGEIYIAAMPHAERDAVTSWVGRSQMPPITT